jgi:DNA-binding NarL/FixJ family response regulator
MIRVMIVDDVPLFRVGLRLALDQMSDCDVIGETTHPADILQVANSQHPDVVLLNQDLATAPAFDIARLLFQHEQRGVFVLAGIPTEEQLFEYQLIGAAAYEARWISAEDLAQKMQRVSAGEYLFSSDSLQIPHKQAPPVTSNCPLSTRDAQILVYIAQGTSNKQIARMLSMSDQTVKNHIAAMLRTLGVTNRTSAVMEALRQNWMMPDGGERGLTRVADQARDEGARSRTRRKPTLLYEGFPLVRLPTDPQVGYRQQTAYCGKARCQKCRAGEGHGPYWYAYQTMHGRTVRRYVGKTLPSPVLSALPLSGCE